MVIAKITETWFHYSAALRLLKCPMMMYNQNNFREKRITMNLISKLKTKEKFTEREAIIADYILSHSEAVVSMSTRALAAATYTSATVIVRFVRKLGYKGFNDFKVRLVSDLKESGYQEIEVEKSEDLLSLSNKVTSLHEKVLLETKNNLALDSLERIQQALKEIDQVDIFALDANGAIGEYASYNIMLSGKMSNVYKSLDKIMLYQSLVHKSMVIVISRLGLNNQMVKAVRNLRAKGHFVIAITSNKESLLAKNSDVSLVSSYKNRIIELGDLSFHTSVSYLLDLIVSIIIKENYDHAVELEQLHGGFYQD